MSVTCVFTAVEAALLASQLPLTECCSTLRARFLQHEAQCEAQGSPSFSMLLSPLEQGLVLGCLANVSCHFSGDLRGRVQDASVAQLKANGVSTGFLEPGPGI